MSDHVVLFQQLQQKISHHQRLFDERTYYGQYTGNTVKQKYFCHAECNLKVP